MTTETKAKQPGADQSAVRLRLCVWGLRLLVGGTFAFSGLVKAIDPWGFIFKIEEYLAVWHLTEPRSVVLMVAMLLSGYEFVLGSLLLMGCYKRTAPWGLLLSMALMLPLSLWLWVADPIPDCGCFGDFLTISNAATFWKNVVLTAGLILLIRWSPRLREALFNPAIQWMVAALASLYILIVSLYGYNAQPMADFRSYPVGSQLAVASDGSEAPDDTDSYTFIYEKEGEQREFSIDSLPDDSWTFVDRIASASAVRGLASRPSPPCLTPRASARWMVRRTAISSLWTRSAAWSAGQTCIPCAFCGCLTAACRSSASCRKKPIPRWPTPSARTRASA